MNFLLTWMHWGLAAMLYLQSAELSKAAPALGDGERKPNEVIKFLEVYERSFCRTIETLVDIFQEYPDEVEYIFKPSCVPLMRCAGCCGDEGLECVPVDVYNVTMEIMRIKPHQSQHIVHMSFLQHSKCDCRPKKDVKNKQEKSGLRASPSVLGMEASGGEASRHPARSPGVPEPQAGGGVSEQSLQARQPSPTQYCCVDQVSPLVWGELRPGPPLRLSRGRITTQSCSRAAGTQLPLPRPGVGQRVRSEQFPFPWGEPLCSGCLLSVSVCPCWSPGTVVCTHRGCVMLSRSLLVLAPHPPSLSHCPSLAGRVPLRDSIRSASAGTSRAGGGLCRCPAAGWAAGRPAAELAGAQEGRRKSVRGGVLCFGPGTCSPVLPHVPPPHPARHMAVFFSPLLPCIFFRFLSVSPFLSFSLSLSLFFFVFLPENQSEERGRVKRESARKAGTNHPAFTVSLAQRGESTCLYKIPRPVNVPANSQTHVASRGSLS